MRTLKRNPLKKREHLSIRFRRMLNFNADISEAAANEIDVGACVIVVECAGRFLFGYNKYRRYWEIPGGKREDDETLLECAMRELEEESGQVVNTAIFSGLVTMHVKGFGITSAGVYFVKLDHIKSTTLTNEWTALNLWKLTELNDNVDSVARDIIVHVTAHKPDIACEGHGRRDRGREIEPRSVP